MSFHRIVNVPLTASIFHLNFKVQNRKKISISMLQSLLSFSFAWFADVP